MKYIKLFEYYTEKGAGVIPCCIKTGKFLIGLRGSMVTQPHCWSNFGGTMHMNSTTEETAIEELWEETQYDGPIELIPGYIYKDSYFTYYNFIGLVPEEYIPNLEDPEYPGEYENDDAKWLTLNELIEIEPKHPGFKAFLENSMDLFRQYAK